MPEDVGAGDLHGPSLRSYYVIFGALCVFTAVSFLVNWALGIGNHTGMAIIMVVAICKATLVGMFFMHLKYEWMKLYFLILVALIFASLVAGWYAKHHAFAVCPTHSTTCDPEHPPGS